MGNGTNAISTQIRFMSYASDTPKIQGYKSFITRLNMKMISATSITGIYFKAYAPCGFIMTVYTYI